MGGSVLKDVSRQRLPDPAEAPGNEIDAAIAVKRCLLRGRSFWQSQGAIGQFVAAAAPVGRLQVARVGQQFFEHEARQRGIALFFVPPVGLYPTS